MHHASARQAVASILGGDGFGEHAVTLVQAVRLHDRADCPAELRRSILDRCLAAPADTAPPYAHPLNQLAIPAEASGLCQQLIPALIAHPADPAAGASALWALAELWPHIGADERPLMRTRLLNTVASRRAPEDAVLTSLQLREWQKKVPTSYGTQAPSVASLRGILQADDPLAAYLLLAEHLGLVVDLETLCWVLGSLAVDLAQTQHDRGGRIASVLAGLVACERMARLVPAEQLVTVISQQAHQLWWLRARGGLHAVRVSLDQSMSPYGAALRSGDITLAQRSARAYAGQQPARYWEESWQAVGEHLLDCSRDLPRIIAMLDAAAWRAGDGAVSGDDAAALACMLSDAIYRQRQG